MDAHTLNLILYTVITLVVLLPFIIVIGVLLLPMCTGCETAGARTTYAIMCIVLILIVFIAASGYTMAGAGREFFIDNFEEYRCKPWFAPFVEWVRPDIDSQENMRKCSSHKTSALLGLMSAPLVNVTKTIGTGMNHTTRSVDIVAKSVSALANTVSQKIEYSQREVSKFQAIGMFMFMKTKAIFDKIGALVFDFYYAFISITDLLNLIFALPEIILAVISYFVTMTAIVMAIILVIGIAFVVAGSMLSASLFLAWLAPPMFFAAKVHFVALAVVTIFFTIITILYSAVKRLYNLADEASYCCFSPETGVLMRDGTTKRMADVRVGDVLLRGVRVRGTFVVRSDARDWHRCGTTLVSSDHLMWSASQQRWLRARDCGPRADARLPHRHCLVTDRHVIPTADGWFSDFQETSRPASLVESAHATLHHLNGRKTEHGTVVPALERGEVQSGFEPSVSVRTAKGRARIRDIRVGDWLGADNQVLGVYRVELRSAIGGRTRNGEWIPCDQIVGDDAAATAWRKWYSVPDVTLEVHDGKLGASGYHLITTRGNFMLHSGLRVRDFLEIRHKHI